MKLNKQAAHIFKDSLWSVCGIVFMNLSAQFLVYPFWERTFGTEKYGNIIYLLSLMNIASIAFGTSAAYTRIMTSTKKETSNSPYLFLLSIISLVSAAYSLILSFVNADFMTTGDSTGYVILCVLTSWRCYADVEYRIYLNYKGYFKYYLFIGTGYILGTFLMSLTGLWSVALIPGEVLGLIFVLAKGHIFRRDKFNRQELSELMRMFAVLLCSNMINSLIFNADRILLKHAIDSSAVSVYYVASLFGKTLSLVTTPLNGVISGYIARFKGTPDIKMKYAAALSAIVLAFSAAAACTAGAYLILPFLYPDTFELAKGSIFICSISQTIYFATNILSVIMLRFAHKRHQIISNILYAAAFAAVCIPLTVIYGSEGFYIGFVITSCSRMIYDIIIIFKIKDTENNNSEQVGI